MPKIINDPIPMILTEAKQLLYAQGPESLNMRDIAKKCHIATGTIYNYFPKKEDLMLRIMIDYWESFIQVIDQLYNEQMDFFNTLPNVYAHFHDFTTNFHALFITNAMRAEYTQNKNCENETKKDFMLRFQNTLIQMIQKSNLNSPTHLDNNEIAEFIISNFIAISYSNNYSYSLFEKVLKSLLSK